MKTEEKAVKLIKKKGATTIDIIATELKVSRQYVHIIVKGLI